MTPASYTEDALIEQPAIALLAKLGWETVSAFGEFNQGTSLLGRETRAEVILTARLRAVLQRLNPEASREDILPEIQDKMIDTMIQIEKALSPYLEQAEYLP